MLGQSRLSEPLEQLHPPSTPKMDTFPRFLELPVELQRHVWQFALPGPRIIELEANRKPIDIRPGVIWSEFNAKVEPIHQLHTLYACHESREMVLQKYQPHFQDLLLRPLYVCPTQDIILMNNSNDPAMIKYLGIRGAPSDRWHQDVEQIAQVDGIRTLALDVTWFEPLLPSLCESVTHTCLFLHGVHRMILCGYEWERQRLHDVVGDVERHLQYLDEKRREYTTRPRLASEVSRGGSKPFQPFHRPKIEILLVPTSSELKEVLASVMG
jgi:2EXR family